MFQPPICKNDRCSKLVPPSKNPGVKKLFCDVRCARRFHVRASYARATGASGSGLLFVNLAGQAQVNRRLPPTSQAAQNRHRAHLAFCGIFAGPCPSRNDPYGRKRECLIGATLADDWSQLKDTEEGKPVKRYATSQDGRWLCDMTEIEQKAAEQRVETKEYFLNKTEREAAFVSGAAKRPEGIQDEALARYNAGLPLSS